MIKPRIWTRLDDDCLDAILAVQADDPYARPIPTPEPACTPPQRITDYTYRGVSDGNFVEE